MVTIETFRITKDNVSSAPFTIFFGDGMLPARVGGIDLDHSYSVKFRGLMNVLLDEGVFPSSGPALQP